MQSVDLIVVGIMLVALIFGAIRGFVREAIALLSWLAGIWVAWRFSGFLNPYMGGVLDGAQKVWAARIIVLILVLFVGHVLGAVLSWLMHTAAGLGAMDRLLGGLFGLVRGAVLIGFLAIIAHSVGLDQEPWWKQSHLAPYVNSVGQWLEDFAGEARPHHHHADQAAGSTSGA